MKTEKETKEWLKSRKLLGRFLNYLYKERSDSFSVFYRRYRHEMFGYAFNWRNTPEGFFFWERVDRDFTHWF